MAVVLIYANPPPPPPISCSQIDNNYYNLTSVRQALVYFKMLWFVKSVYRIIRFTFILTDLEMLKKVIKYDSRTLMCAYAANLHK